MKKLTQLEAQLYLLNQPQPITDSVWRIYVIATLQLTLFLGRDWFEKHIAPSYSRKKGGFLLPQDDRVESFFLSTTRIVSLAEYFYNFYEVRGFLKYINTYKSRIDIEASFAELQVAKLLKTNGIPFYFIEPTNKQGADYDLEVILPTGEPAACETKCKLSSSDFSENAIFNSMNETLKRKQLPKDRHSILFVSIPSSWLFGEGLVTDRKNLEASPNSYQRIQANVNSATLRFFSKSSRILQVIYYTEATFDLGDKSKSGTIVKAQIILDNYINNRSPFAINYRSILDYLDEDAHNLFLKQELKVLPRPPIQNRRWITLQSLID